MIHYILNTWWLLLIVIIASSIAITSCILFARNIVRAGRWLIHKFFPSTVPSWKIIMSTKRDAWRPRYFSLHTLAALLGRTDLLQLAKEMKRSCEVNASFCGEVKSPVFYLNRFSDHNNKETWKSLKDFVARYPFPETRGFQRADGTWSGGQYGKGTYTPPVNAMPDPFIKDDYAYANKILAALRQAGRTPGIKEYKIDKQ